ncbi:MAG: hypothetical protein E4H38_04085 [Gemmatimonadales bacterium]|nr:MAG: hypothetical protein E4H38_04085 [Gemmatimonadales bacterium]
MGTTLVRDKLATSALSGRYATFLALGGVLTVAGLALFAVALSGTHSDRAWHLFHVNWVYFTGLTAGSFAFVAVQKITKAKWSGVIIRFAEAAPFFFFPVSLAGFILIFTVGYHHIFPEMHGLGHGKEVWLSHPFMFGRLAVGLALLYWLGFALVKADMVPDLHDLKEMVEGGRRGLYGTWTAGFDPSPAGRAAHEAKIARLAPMYVVVYAIVLSMVAFDTMMALQPHWFSNLFGGWYFMGSFLGAHTLLALTMLHGQREIGIEEFVSPKQRHDLGKLCFGFSVFWTYLMWSQFLVIWYGNLPEETGFVFARLWGEWRPVGAWVFLGLFVIPFIGLLGVAPKKNPFTLGLFTAISLVTLWVERYLMVLPSVTHEAGPVFGLPELAPTALFLGLFLVAYALFARTFPMVSPRLAEITLDRERGHGHPEVSGEFDHEEGDGDYAGPDALNRRHRQR